MDQNQSWLHIEPLQHVNHLRTQYLIYEQNLKEYLGSHNIHYSLHAVKLLIVLYYGQEVACLNLTRLIKKHIDGEKTFTRAIYPAIIKQLVEDGLISTKPGKKQTMILNSLTKKGKKFACYILEILAKFEE